VERDVTAEVNGIFCFTKLPLSGQLVNRLQRMIPSLSLPPLEYGSTTTKTELSGCSTHGAKFSGVFLPSHLAEMAGSFPWSISRSSAIDRFSPRQAEAASSGITVTRPHLHFLSEASQI